MAKDSLFFCFVLLSAATLAIPLPDAHPLRSSLHGWSHSTQPAPAPDASVTAHEAPLRFSESRTPITSDWVLSPPPPFSIMEHAMVPVACDSSISYPPGTAASIILIGGSNASGAASASVISFDVGRRLWRALQPLPHPREAAMAVFSQSWGGVVVCGGRCRCCIVFSNNRHLRMFFAESPNFWNSAFASCLYVYLHPRSQQFRLFISAAVDVLDPPRAKYGLDRARRARHASGAVHSSARIMRLSGIIR
jgi:hypothetical protein